MLSLNNIPPFTPASKILDDSEESGSESEDDTISINTDIIENYTMEDIDLEDYKKLKLTEKYMLQDFRKYEIGYDDLQPALKSYNKKRDLWNLNDNINSHKKDLEKIKNCFHKINKLNENIDVIKKDINNSNNINKEIINNPKTIEDIQHNINIYKKYSNTENLSVFSKNILKYKRLKRNKYYNELLNDFYEHYNQNLVTCKYKKCEKKCYNDVMYCLEHYPKVCSQCAKICDTENNPMDYITTNKYYGIIELCGTCTKEKFLEYYRENYSKDKIFMNIKDENHLDNILYTMNYENFLANSKIFNELLKVKEEKKISNAEFKNYLCSEKTLTTVLNIPEKTLKENKSFKYQLYRQLTRTNDLVQTFGDKIKYINITNYRFRRMSYFQFQAFKDYLFELIYGKDYLFNEEFYKNIFENIEEPDTSSSTNCCISCGVGGILPNKEMCLNCEFIGIT